ncbi:O-antigen ligase family protein [Microvirga sp. 2MCAF38]|uniref:O-antigen ligase family protein n=1 Tax=Microvirga sp. 2MCAF38 TaxID=3232989 RepID=UPI003F9C97CF
MIERPPSGRLPLVWLPTVIALGWVMLLTQAATYGNFVYAVPLLLVGATLGGLVFIKAVQGNARAIALLLFFTVFFLSLNFRVRPLGEVGLDWQNGTKFATWAAVVTIAVLRWREIIFLFKEPVISLALAYACMAFVSAMWSEVPAYSAASAFGLLAYIALACMLVVDLGEDVTLRVMMWSLLAYIVCSIAAMFVVPDIAWLPPSVEETTWRFRGLSGHPNVLGQQVGIFIVLAVINYHRRLISLPLFSTLVLVGVLVLFAAQSRTALLAIGAAGGLIFLRQSRFGPAVAFLTVGALAVLVLAIALGGPGFIKSFLGSFSRTGISDEIFTLTGRTEIWNVALQRWAEKPLLGWGFNGTEDLIARSIRPAFNGNAVNAHNMFLQSLLSLGFLGSIPGFALLAILFARFFVRPDLTRDLIVVYLVLNGLGEVELFATPVLLTLVFFWAIVREGDKTSDVPQPRAGHAFSYAAQSYR